MNKLDTIAGGALYEPDSMWAETCTKAAGEERRSPGHSGHDLRPQRSSKKAASRWFWTVALLVLLIAGPGGLSSYAQVAPGITVEESKTFSPIPYSDDASTGIDIEFSANGLTDDLTVSVKDGYENVFEIRKQTEAVWGSEKTFSSEEGTIDDGVIVLRIKALAPATVAAENVEGALVFSSPGLGIKDVDVTYRITPAPLSIVVNNDTKCYGVDLTGVVTEFGVGARVSVSGLVTGESISSVTLSSSGFSNSAAAGSYGISLSEDNIVFASGSADNYDITISPASPVITVGEPISVNIVGATNTSICNGKPVNLNLSFPGGYTGYMAVVNITNNSTAVTEEFGFSFNPTGLTHTQVIAPEYFVNDGATPIIYTISWNSLTVGGEDGCAANNMLGAVDITVNPTPEIIIVDSEDEPVSAMNICSGTSGSVNLSKANEDMSDVKYNVTVAYNGVTPGTGAVPLAGRSNQILGDFSTGILVNSTGAAIDVVYQFTPITSGVSSPCAGTTKTLTVTVAPAADFDLLFASGESFDSENKATLCQATTIALYVDGHSGFTYILRKVGEDGSLEEAFTMPVSEDDAYELTTALSTAGTYRLYAQYGSSSCIDSVDYELIINEKPVFTVSINDETAHESGSVIGLNQVCEGQTFSININGEGLDNSYSYTIMKNVGGSKDILEEGDLDATGTAGPFEIMADPEAAAIYEVYVTNEETGCVASRNYEIIVNPAPVFAVNINGSAASESADNVVCEGDDVALTITGADDTHTYVWKNADTEEVIYSGTVGTDPLPSFEALTERTGTYALTLTNPATGCTTTKMYSLLVNPAPVFTVSINGTPANEAGSEGATNAVCAGDDVSLVITGADPSHVYEWRNIDTDELIETDVVGDGILTSFEALAERAGTYSLTLTNPVTGCTTVKEYELEVGTIPSFTFQINGETVSDSETICQATETSFQIVGSTAGFQWDITHDGIPFASSEDEDGYGPIRADGTSAIHEFISGAGSEGSPSTAGEYVITVTNPATGCSLSRTIDLYMNPKPTVATAEQSEAICPGETINIDFTGLTPNVTTEMMLSYINPATELEQTASVFTTADAAGTGSMTLNAPFNTPAYKGTVINITKMINTETGCEATISDKSFVIRIGETAPVVEPIAAQTLDVGAGESCTVLMPDYTYLINSTTECGYDVTVRQLEPNQPASAVIGYEGYRTVVFEVEDIFGNVTTASMIVNLVDKTPPVALSHDVIDLYLDAEGQVSVTADQLNNGSYDNCPLTTGVSVFLLESNEVGGDDIVTSRSFTCDGASSHVVRLLVKDPAGNESIATTIVNIYDTIAPVIDAAAVSAAAEELPVIAKGVNCTNELGSWDFLLDEHVSDNCSQTFSYTQFPSASTIIAANQENVNVILIATDEAGLSDSVNITLTFRDLTAPVISGLEDDYLRAEAGECSVSYWLPEYGIEDNCSDNDDISVVITFNDEVTTGSELILAIGEHTIAYTVTDAAGNDTTVSMNVMVWPSYELTVKKDGEDFSDDYILVTDTATADCSKVVALPGLTASVVVCGGDGAVAAPVEALVLGRPEGDIFPVTDTTTLTYIFTYNYTEGGEDKFVTDTIEVDVVVVDQVKPVITSEFEDVYTFAVNHDECTRILSAEDIPALSYTLASCDEENYISGWVLNEGDHVSSYPFIASDSLAFDGLDTGLAPGVYTFTYIVISRDGESRLDTASFRIVIESELDAALSATSNVVELHSPLTNTVTFTATGGQAPYVFDYSLNNLMQTPLISSAGTSTIPQSNDELGEFVYKLHSVTDARGCSLEYSYGEAGDEDERPTVVINVVLPSASDLKPAITTVPTLKKGTARTVTFRMVNAGETATETGKIRFRVNKPFIGYLFDFTLSEGSGFTVSSETLTYWDLESVDELTIEPGEVINVPVNVIYNGNQTGSANLQMRISTDSNYNGNDTNPGNNTIRRAINVIK